MNFININFYLYIIIIIFIKSFKFAFFIILEVGRFFCNHFLSTIENDYCLKAY